MAMERSHYRNRYIMRYMGEYDSLTDVVVHVRTFFSRERKIYHVRCPFCGSPMKLANGDPKSPFLIIGKDPNSSSSAKPKNEEKLICDKRHRISVSLNDNQGGLLGWE